MINFPVLDQLDISGYGLFPGSETAGLGLHITFQPGLTLVVGANGLGKTTLVSILYRLLTGPFDIPGIVGQPNLGSLRLEPKQLWRGDREVFAQRVADGARNAVARLSFKLGTHELVVERRISELSLVHFSVDGVALALEEEVFQSEIARLVGLWSFGDWILLLRHLMFYFEDRRALVWDPSAQRQILRFLFLPVAIARKWTEDERAILELDSRMRNLSAALSREERALAGNEFKTQAGANIRQQLSQLEELQAVEEQRLEQLNDQVAQVEAHRQGARLRALKEEQEQESRYRELERAKLTSIGARFPGRSETARYILAQLLTERICLVCGTEAPQAATDYAARIDHKMCVICGTDLSAVDSLVPTLQLADQRVQAAAAALEGIEKDLDDARRLLKQAENQYQSHYSETQQLNYQIAERSNQIDSLVKRLPPAEAEMHRQRSELASMRSRVEQLREDLNSKRDAFRKFVEEISRYLVAQSEQVKQSFDEYAEGFMLELCRLVWSPRKDRVGQTGELIDFPAFEIEMTGTDFQIPVRRTNPDQVSESQREFIDLAFRMSLMAVAGSQSGTTLIIDAPESSLDAVFVSRATQVLSRFAEPARNNRLVVTSNLVEGQLLPGLIASATASTDTGSRIVDLFSIAIPTAAVLKLRNEYDKVRLRLLDNTGAGQ